MSLNPNLASSAIGSAASGLAKQNRDVAQEILRAVEELKQGSGFGSVEIVLHEGRVTQIEKREKLRFTQANGSIANASQEPQKRSTTS